VDRYWKPRTEDARDAVEAVINAIQSVTERQEHTACSVFSYTKTEPSVTHKAVDVICGGHKIELSVLEAIGWLVPNARPTSTACWKFSLRANKMRNRARKPH
jgi:hypothetical protein